MAFCVEFVLLLWKAGTSLPFQRKQVKQVQEKTKRKKKNNNKLEKNTSSCKILFSSSELVLFLYFSMKICVNVSVAFNAFLWNLSSYFLEKSPISEVETLAATISPKLQVYKV